MKRLFALFLTLETIMGFAHAEIYSGACGANLTWTINTADSTLSIEGAGNIEIGADGPQWSKYTKYIAYVSLPDGLTGIGWSTFGNCYNLKTITIPKNVASISNDFVFYNCKSLTEILVDSDNENFCSEDGVLFNKDKTIIIAFPPGKQGLYTIPSSITSIGNYAFENCVSLTTLTIPNSVTKISDYAFLNVPNIVCLSSASGSPWGARNVNGYVEGIFVYNDDSKTELMACSAAAKGEIVIPDGVQTISGIAFYECWKVTSIKIPQSVKSIGNSSFIGCSGLSSLEVPNTVTSIGDYAFADIQNVVYNGSAEGSPWGARSVNGYIEGWFIYNDDTKTILRVCSDSAIGDIALPASVTDIENYAFKNCSKITSLSFPENLINIGEYAFSGCDNITSISIPEKVAALGNGAFSGCSKLTTVSINSNIVPRYSSSLVAKFGSQVQTYILGDSVTYIGTYTFSNCPDLMSITIGKNVENIGQYSFNNCPFLTTVTINSNKLVSNSYGYYSSFNSIFGNQVQKYILGEDITSIGECAFCSCGMTEINIPNKVYSIEKQAFYGCNNLTSIIIPDGVQYINESTFANCLNLTSVIIGEGVLNIGNYAFRGCPLNTLTIGDNVRYIGYEAFSGCTNLTEVTIPENVSDISSRAFYGCPNLTSIKWNAKYCNDNAWGDPIFYNVNEQITSFTFGDNVLNIPASLCQNMPLETITIPNSVISIGNRAFSGCYGLREVTISENVTNIGNNVFQYCYNLTTVNWNAKKCADFNGSPFNDIAYQIRDFNFGNEVEYIPANLCQGLSNVASFNIPKIVKEIGANAFKECTNLASINLPEGITTIGESAFFGCSNLKTCNIPNSVTIIGKYPFRDCNSLTIPLYNERIFACLPVSYVGYYNIPNSIESIVGGACWGCKNLTSLTIPESVTSMGDYVISGCVALDTLTILSASSALPLLHWDISGNGGEELPNLKHIEAPAEFFDVPENQWVYCPKYLTEVVITEGLMTDNIFAVIGRSYKTLKELDVSAVTNTEFADEAFKGYYKLESLQLPTTLERVSYMMVAGCKNLKSIDIPTSVVEIDQSAFEDCRSMETLTFGGKQPNNKPGLAFATAASTSQLRKIGNWAFYNAHQLQHLEIPEGVEEIGEGAFYGCTYLQDLVLPKSIRAIGDNCFALCSHLEKITVEALTPPTIYARTFFDVSRNIPVYVPEDVVSEYINDEYWKEMNIQSAPTGIEEVISMQSDGSSQKILHNGQLLIVRNGETYNAQGARVE